MSKEEIMGLCEFLKLHGYENTDNISKFVFGLQQKYKQQQELINKAIDLLNTYIGVLDDTSDLFFKNVKSILEAEEEK